MQTFAYETTENGARILRCFSCDKRVEIPERLEGLIVREIGDGKVLFYQRIGW